MKKLLFLLLSIMIFIPSLNAEEQTYYDWEIEVVEELPTASDSTTNKVYQVGELYYVTEVLGGKVTPIPLNENMNGRTIYVNLPSDFITILSEKCTWMCAVTTGTNVIMVDLRSTARLYYGNYNYIDNVTSFTPEIDFIITGYNSGYEAFADYFSLAPFETTYEWQEVPVYNVLDMSQLIYVPDLSYSCYVVQSEGVIRAYEEMPKNDSTVSYRDYYINSSYIFRDGYQNFSAYATLPTCLSSNIITDDFYYRLDLDKILVIFTILVIFGILLPLKILSKLFKRGAL